jgi:hypothetical protein
MGRPDKPGDDEGGVFVWLVWFVVQNQRRARFRGAEGVCSAFAFA